MNKAWSAGLLVWAISNLAAHPAAAAPVVGDFNADGSPDLVIEDVRGGRTEYAFDFRVGGFGTNQPEKGFSDMPAGFQIVAAGVFATNGNGLLLKKGSDGQLWIFTGSNPVATTKIELPDAFKGRGKVVASGNTTTNGNGDVAEIVMAKGTKHAVYQIVGQELVQVGETVKLSAKVAATSADSNALVDAFITVKGKTVRLQDNAGGVPDPAEPEEFAKVLEGGEKIVAAASFIPPFTQVVTRKGRDYKAREVESSFEIVPTSEDLGRTPGGKIRVVGPR